MISLPVNSSAPDFTLINQVGKPVTMSDLVRLNKVLLIFYPTDWGQLCFHELSTFRDRQSEFEKTGYQLVGISYNDTVSHGLWSEYLKLRFPILSDRDGAVAASYGVLDDDKESFNLGRSDRALFMVNQEMVITWSWVGKYIWFEPDYDQVLRVAQEG
ncbi:MAG: redoxin domain-containing protein [Methanomassiliicoccales archaeon]